MAEPSSPLPRTEVEDFAFQHSSPHSLCQQPFSSPPAPPLVNIHDYNFSPHAHVDDESTSASATDMDVDDNAPHDANDLALSAGEDDDRRISGASSISSFPASVSDVHRHVHVPIEQPRTPLCSPPLPLEHNHSRAGSLGRDLGSQRAGGRERVIEYTSAFRNPSSVVAMQMQDEDLESVAPYHVHGHRRSGSRMSNRSHHSAYSTQTSPTKRLSSRSNQSSPLKGSGSVSKLKKEFPLVLLHCTLLPAAHRLQTQTTIYDDEVLGAILPPEYRKRWNMLQDRLANVEVKTRGVLIPHPKEDYELLEERLLESLELEKPRIRRGHFLGHDGGSADSGFESASQTEEDSEEELHGVKCLDCGRKVQLGEEVDRKWEIKVYAANGLMRAGAWNAAWREMEKVDVEIALWMPDELRRDVNAKLEALAASETDPADFAPQGDMHSVPASPQHGDREREIYGRARSQDEIDGLFEEARQPRQDPTPLHHQHAQPQPGLMVLLENYFKVLTNDRMNVVIALLSVLVLIYAVLGGSAAMQSISPEPSPVAVAKSVEVLTTTITSTATSMLTTTMTTSQVVEVLATPSVQIVVESIIADPVEDVKISEPSQFVEIPETPRVIAEVDDSEQEMMQLADET